ncbi:hypothetical protein OPKNFCMD_2921 [Methylobacterium crusticola]|uniref:Aspartate kinase n=1 Tax=Methylobacterium crusticola TaxID=1697972 RepID=A0ABQ4QZ27_9HYPH|nr:hypothetical protein [Methylobacterium crusticola]GJD50184.1 hypothetical protein OPKNFCMD_2921 [Methylobacterium crusticola]
MGFLAAAAARLAGAGIAVNPVPAHYDYLFFPSWRAEEALGLPEDLAGG